METEQTTLPLVVEIYQGKERSTIEIRQDMAPQSIEMGKGDMICFKDFTVTVPEPATYQVHAHGVTRLG